MNLLDEYRRHARECQRMADGTGNASDKASWLRLAASWLGMIESEPSRVFGVNSKREDEPEERPGRAWPDPSDEDSTASH